MSKYSKNFILCGDVDYFCLLCKESFELSDEVEKHIRWEQHRKLIRCQEYMPKLRKEKVFKLGDYYFCEVCNYVTRPLEAMKNHVKEESHKACKANPVTNKKSLAKREFDFIVVSKIVVNKREWHGIFRYECLFCNMAVGNFNGHIATAAHMISLIQSEIVCENDDQVYRKINEDTIYCFKCKKTYTVADLPDHWTSNEHVGKKDAGKVEHLFEIDKENWIATCNVCHEAISWSLLPMNQHRNKHVEKNEWLMDKNEVEEAFLMLTFQDRGKLRSELKKFGKENFIKMNEGGSKGYCTLCNTHISAHIRNFRQHVNGVRHTNFLELEGIIKTTKKPEKLRHKTKPFMNVFPEISHLRSSSIFLVPSVELCIEMMSLTLIARVDNKTEKIICFVCGGTYPNMQSHLKNEHITKMLATNVITTVKNEFIREIRPGLYHCGVCNMSYAGWSVFEKHLSVWKHRSGKIRSHETVEKVIAPNIFDDQGNRLDESYLHRIINYNILGNQP